ncbi:acyltransferase family protein [Acinetobacter bouvetii]|uniref:Acyltransferase family protein n=1 Tax=Acinetobacter bouvetii TaxID=202951 RepID=A0A811G779_9GAMM|nr:acyltransferase [Acinetobacter bouvetii]CAB1210317.1 Acyltransferase family protein [Acinetobacter bouvetii]
MNQYLDIQYLILPIFICCLILSCLIIKKLIPTNAAFESLSRTSPLDGLRGVLALSVLVHHFYITYIWKTQGEWVRPESDLLNNMGAIPVSLFFLITGYLFLNKIQKSEINWKQLYILRLKRIVPLYAFVTFIVLGITLMSIHLSEYSLSQYIKWILGWVLFKGSSLETFPSPQIIAGVNWTLLYEWGFYFSLPLIHALVHKKISNKHIFVITFILFLVVFLETKRSLYLLFLLSFISIYYKNKIEGLIKEKTKLLNILLPSILLISLIFTTAYSTPQKILLSIVFAFICNGYNFFGLLNHAGIRILGDISYSTYLIHGLILYLSFSILNVYDFSQGLIHYYLLFPLVFSVVVITSFATYHFIERPFLKRK